ncbi:tetratricopeptide repeat protein [Streptomyces sp. DSM 44917]|uniref:Tetratricopeptide repeat protein n=2 Tax=Streptomyces boetiae TaxID=3075541 RepID=A0ABU2LGC2_9ACTN|nr:tetratricopeptide repeat protein [Streptomyces sp. DSM 44917]MDT0310288.1 tetratricopeptide repeat protein [Streptomyces sp. DSM 44917]
MTEQAVTDGAGTPGFLGRRRELAQLRSDLERAGLDTMAGRPAPRGRVLLVAGRPGTGRTALAEEFAAALAAGGEYPGGVLRARLTDPAGEPVPAERAARDLLGPLGAGAPPGAAEDEVTGALRDALAERRAVLLLDDVASAAQLDELIPGTRDCVVVAVAGGPLTGVPDVRPCVLGGLERDAALRLLERGAGDVRITVDPGAAEALAESCGHLPAALTLVGGWLAARPDATLAEAVRALARAVPEAPPVPPPAGEGREARGEEAFEGGVFEDGDGDFAEDVYGAGGFSTGTHGRPPYDDRAFDGLDAHADGDGIGEEGAYEDEGAPPGSAPRLPPPEPALRRAFHLAHAALPAPAARTLRLLALAPAGLVDAHIASALAGWPVPAARAALEDLAARGLLRPEPGTPGLHRVPGCLYPLLRERLEAAEKPSEALLARARMLERTVRLLRACQAVTEPHGTSARAWLSGLPASLRFESRPAAARWLAERQPALLAAARTAVADGRLDTLARRLVAALTRALIAHRGPEDAAPELYRLHELVLDVAERHGLTRERAAALLNLGDLDARCGRLGSALERYRGALEAARAEREQAEPPGQAGGTALLVGRALESIAGTYAEQGDWQRAADWYGRAVAQAVTRGDLPAQARLYGRIGAAETRTGHWTEALRAWRAACAVHRRLGDGRAHARSLAAVARVQEYAGRPEESLRTAQEALRLARAAGDRRLQAALRLRLADCCDRLGRTGEAAAHRDAAELLLAHGRPPAEAPAPAYETELDPRED